MVYKFYKDLNEIKTAIYEKLTEVVATAIMKALIDRKLTPIKDVVSTSIPPNVKYCVCFVPFSF